MVQQDITGRSCRQILWVLMVLAGADGLYGSDESPVPSPPTPATPTPATPTTATPTTATPTTAAPDRNLEAPPPPRRLTIAERLQQTRPARARMARSSLSSSLNVFLGDGGQGGCGTFGSPNNDFLVDHPTFACNRLNIAENNLPLPLERVYLRYSHFENASQTRIPSADGTFSAQQDIERYTLGWEHLVLDGAGSLELRVPIVTQLTSDLSATSLFGQNDLPLDDLSTSLDNVGLVGKLLLWERETFLLSGGLGASFPTAQDVNVRISALGLSSVPQPFALDIHGVIENSVYRLTPFLAAAWRPRPRWTFQSFLQVDVPLNDTQLAVGGSGVVSDPNGPNDTLVRFDPLAGDINPQTLMRINAGVWRNLMDHPGEDWLTSLTACCELHYTTTLENADILNGQGTITQVGAPVDIPDTYSFSVGNWSNRIDILNLTLGMQAGLGKRTQISSGFVLPLRDANDRPFDFEFVAQINRRF